jgi:hypothetical protein
LVSSIFCLVSSNSFGQYSHSRVGISSEYVGSYLVANFGSLTYTDNGGSGDNYSNSINNIYCIFCPSVTGNRVDLDLSQQVEECILFQLSLQARHL